MSVRLDDDLRDEAYFEGERRRGRSFDAELLREPLGTFTHRKPLIFALNASVSDAMRAMQREHTGCVLLTGDGTARMPLLGIFTERDVLLRIIDRGRNPASLPLSEVMTAEPESVLDDAPLAWVLNRMAVGGYRHVPVVDAAGRPTLVVSVRDVVEFLVDAFPREVLNLPGRYGPPRAPTREGA